MLSSVLAYAAERLLTWLAQLGLRELGQWELERQADRDSAALQAAQSDEERKKALSALSDDSFPPLPPDRPRT